MVGRDALSFGADRSVPLAVLPQAFAARGPSSLSFVAELTYDEEGPADRLGAVTSALSAPGRAHDVVVALRALGPAAPRFAWTREGFGAPDLAQAPQPVDTILDAMGRRSETRSTSALVARVVAGPPAHASTAATAAVAPAPPAAPAVVPTPSLQPGWVTPPAAVDLEEEPALVREVILPPAPPPEVEASEGADVDAGIQQATAAGDWRRVAELRLDRLAAIADPKAQVRELVAVARVLQAELADPEGAITVLERARAIEPTRQGVLRALRRGYEAHGRWAHAVDVLESLAALAETGNERAGYRAAQARIATDHLADAVAARTFLNEALLADPLHPEAMALASRLDAPAEEGAPAGGPPVDPAPFGAAGPLDAAPYASAFAAYDAQGNIDGAFVAALALEEIGVAGDGHRAVLERWRTVGPVRARASLDAWAWEQLRAPGHDDVIAALFAAVEGAAIGARIDEMRDAQRLPALDRSQRLSETSTASIVRSFQWAARFLGVRCPDLYAIDDAPGMAVVHGPDPSTALGRSVLSGPTAKDLAFLAGRHLTFYRPEYHVLLYYPTRDELTALLFAAVQMASTDVPSVPPAVRAIRGRLERRMGTAERIAVRDVVRRLNERGGQAQIGAWMRGIELTAARAGLLLCGDLATAARIARAESRVEADLTLEERRADLVSFCASPAHVALRARFVATSAESVMPAASAVTHRTAAQ
jgi:hypothetical protein